MQSYSTFSGFHSFCILAAIALTMLCIFSASSYSITGYSLYERFTSVGNSTTVSIALQSSSSSGLSPKQYTAVGNYTNANSVLKSSAIGNSTTVSIALQSSSSSGLSPKQYTSVGNSTNANSVLQSSALRCPASSLINTSVDGYLGYPREFFDGKSSSTTSFICGFDEKIRNGYNWNMSDTSLYVYEDQHKTRCGGFTNSESKDPCPVSDLNIRDFMKIRFTKGMHEFLKANLADTSSDSSHPLRVFLFGGSVPAGGDASGCCCSVRADMNCKITCHKTRSSYGYRYAPECTWIARLIDFFRAFFHPRVVSFVDYSKGGSNSAHGAAVVSALTASGSPIILTPNDIVFIDYSTNDAFFNHGIRESSDLSVMAANVESLVLALLKPALKSSVLANATRQYLDFHPSIVILEQWPFRDYYSSFHEFNSSGIDYSLAYHRIADLYNLELWSLQDVGWHEYRPFLHETLTYQRQGGILFNNVYSPGIAHHHPRWHVHLFLADLVAAAIVRSAKYFEKLPPENYTTDPTYYLPPPYDRANIDSAGSSCSTVMGNYNSAVELNRVGTEIEVSAVSIPKCFLLGSEGDDKTGWISTLSESSSATCSKDFIFNSSSAESQYRIHVEYLRSYENAGVVSLKLCNQDIASLDALWEISSPRVSMIALKTIQFNTTAFPCIAGVPSFSVRAVHSKALDRLSERKPSQKFRLIRIWVCALLP